MHKFLLAFFVICNVNQNESVKLWTSGYQLQWNDFKGIPQPGTPVAAVTASGLSFGFSSTQTEKELVSYEYHVVSHFYPEKSWYIKDRANDNILEHERLHFDITELFARKFRKQIENTSFTLNIQKEMQEINVQINKELKAFQNRYDNETEHSINIKAQKEWEKAIILELQKHNYYRY